MGLFVFLTVLVVLQGPYLAHGECPHFDMTLQRWSMWSEKVIFYYIFMTKCFITCEISTKREIISQTD